MYLVKYKEFFAPAVETLSVCHRKENARNELAAMKRFHIKTMGVDYLNKEEREQDETIGDFEDTPDRFYVADEIEITVTNIAVLDRPAT